MALPVSVVESLPERPNMATYVASETIEEWRTCVPCEKSFSAERAYKAHLKTDGHLKQLGHAPERKFACEVCGKAFTRDTDRRRHQRRLNHNLQKPYRPMATPSSENLTPNNALEAFEQIEQQSDFLQDFAEFTISPPVHGSVPSSLIPMKRGRESGEEWPQPSINSRVQETRAALDIQDESTMQDEDMQDSVLNTSTDLDHDSAMEETSGGFDNLATPSSHAKPESTPGASETSAQFDSGIDMNSTPGDSVTQQLEAFTSKQQARHSRRTSVLTFASSVISKKSFVLPFRNRSSLERHGATQATPARKRKKLCHICRQPYSLYDPEAAIAHMKQHLDPKALREHLCEDCDIGFQNEADLQHHLSSVAEHNHCGFNYKHLAFCTGHHPREANTDGASFSDHDRFALGYLLREWEQAQLHSLMAVIDLLPTEYEHLGKRWSVSMRRMLGSNFSLPSVMASLWSTPTDVDYGASTNINHIQRKLVEHGKGNAKSSLILANAQRGAQLIKTKRTDHEFSNAVANGDYDKVNEILVRGVDVNKSVAHLRYKSPFPEVTPLALAADFGHKSIVKLLLYHGARPDTAGESGFSALQLAASKGHLNVVQVLLEEAVPLNTLSQLGQSALHLAAVEGHDAAVSLLLEHGASVDLRDKFLRTPLHLATTEGHSDTMAILLENGADKDAVDAIGETALHKCLRFHPENVSLLLDSGLSIDPNETSTTDLMIHLLERECIDGARILLENSFAVNTETSDGRSLLQHVVNMGSVAATDLLLEYGANIDNNMIRDQKSSLEVAVCLKSKELVELLLENGARWPCEKATLEAIFVQVIGIDSVIAVESLIAQSVDVNMEACTLSPLYDAVLKASPQMVSVLLSHGARVAKYEQTTVLAAAARRGSVEVTELVIDMLQDDYPDVLEDTIDATLVAAVAKNHAEVVKLLLDRGAGLHHEVVCGQGTVLCNAVESGFTTIVQILLSRDANCNQEIGRYGSLVGCAGYHGFAEIVQLLIHAGADVNQAGGECGTPLGHAAFAGRSVCIEILLKYGAKINATSYGVCTTALGWAAYGEHPEATELLCKAGAAVDQYAGYYGSALNIAAYRGRDDLITILLDYGADVNLQSGVYGNALCTVTSHSFRKESHGILRHLLEKGANAACEGPSGTPISILENKRTQLALSGALEDEAGYSWISGREGQLEHCKDLIRMLERAAGET